MAISFMSGDQVTAAQLNELSGLSVTKTSDQSVVSSTSLQPDAELMAALPGAGNYIFQCYLNFEGGAQGASDLKLEWTVPAGSSMRFQAVFTNLTPAASVSDTFTDTQLIDMSTNGATVLQGALMSGTLFAGATTGHIQLMWAQHTSNATPTIIHAGSYMLLQQV